MRLLMLMMALAGCGDNKAAAVPPADVATVVETPVNGCSSGSNVYLDQIAALDGTITMVTSPPDDPHLFVEQDGGKIWIIDEGEVLPEPFLDVTVGLDPPYVGGSGQEIGLLGLAFDPQYATNRTFFINYTASSTDPSWPYLDVTMRMQTSADDWTKADPSTAAVVLAIPDFAANHNGGMLEFGPDGYLYIGDGDGGFADDPMLTGQDPFELLGKISRIDVANKIAGKEYSIPADNPFADGTNGAPEAYILGVRNPWRFSFDKQNGDLWIADVGQDAYEELDVLHPGEQNGANLGWSMYEANTCFHPPCDPTGLTFPKDVRSHNNGWCAIIGGAVYRGSCYPDLDGTYFYTDYCRGGLSTARLQADDTLEINDLGNDLPYNPASLHYDAAGELYVADLYGNLFHIRAQP